VLSSCSPVNSSLGILPIFCGSIYLFNLMNIFVLPTFLQALACVSKRCIHSLAILVMSVFCHIYSRVDFKLKAFLLFLILCYCLKCTVIEKFVLAVLLRDIYVRLWCRLPCIPAGLTWNWFNCLLMGEWWQFLHTFLLFSATTAKTSVFNCRHLTEL